MRTQHQIAARSAVAVAVVILAGVFLVPGRPGLARELHAQPAPMTMYVSVLDKDGAPVPGLSANEFVVRENGVRREVLRVSQPASDPIDIALVVDNTAASSPSVQDIRNAVTAFVETMHAKNFISLVTFADRPTVFTDYTHDLVQLKAGIGRLFSVDGSGSYLLDALVEVSRGLAKRKAERAAVIVLSTDGIELGNYNYQQVLEALANGGASLNAIILNPKTGAQSNDATRSRAIVLDRGPRESGGVRYDTLTSMAFTEKLNMLATQLMNQYRVVYSRPESIIPPDKFDVSVTRPGLDAHGTPVRRQSR
jgi:Ca-activated chloride channel family protein